MEKHSMRLRSACRQDDRKCAIASIKGSVSASSLQSSRAGSSQSHHSCSHHHHHHRSSAETATAVNKSASFHSLPHQVSQSPRHHDTGSQSSVSNTMASHPLTRHLYSYDQMDDRPKTDYTYVRSGIYCSRVPPDYKVEMPNMSRPKLGSRSSSASSTFSSELEDSLEALRIAQSPPSHSVTHSVTNTQYHQSQSILRRFVGGWTAEVVQASSTPITNGSSQNHWNSHARSSSSGGSSTGTNERNEARELEIEGRTSWSRRCWSMVKDVVTLKFVVLLARHILSVWNYLWVYVYNSVCQGMLSDLWILSRLSYVRSWKFLLPLFLLFLFLVFKFPHEGLYGEESSELESSHSEEVWLFDHWKDDTFWWKTYFSYQNIDDSETPSSTPRFPEENGTIEKSKTDEPVAFLMWFPFSSYLFPTKETEDMVDNKPLESIMQHSNAAPHVASINADELAALTQEIRSWKSSMATELHQMHIKFMAKVEERSKDIADEVQVLKTRIINLEERSQDDSQFQSYIKENQKLKEDVARLERELQTYVLATRNCCQNSTVAFLSLAEEQFASLLRKVMSNEHQDADTGKMSSSPFMAFRNWLRSNQVERTEIDLLMATMQDRILENASSTIKGLAENISRSVASEAALHRTEMTRLRMQFYGNRSTSSSASVNSQCLSRDEVQRLIDDKIVLYDSDKTGMVDYALESAGGSIVSTRCAETYDGRIGRYTIFGIPFWYSIKSPRTVIQPDVHPGQCWPFEGSQGYLVISLAAAIRPTAFSLEHIPKSLSVTGNIDSAPRDFSVWGLKAEDDYDVKLLGQYTYHEDGPPLQHFIVQDPDPGVFSMVELRILNNHGNMEYTCLYRFRVHGKKV